MASLICYVKRLFASSYGTYRPEFFIWHPKGLPSSEKKLLFKIDLCILTYACLAYFTKWLDQANLSNAYVSGMKEDLKMFGTEYNLASTCFSVGQILGPIPPNVLLTWIPPRVLLPGLELLWAGLTIGTYAVKDVNQVIYRVPRSHMFENYGLMPQVALSNSIFRWIPRSIDVCRNPIRSRIVV